MFCLTMNSFSRDYGTTEYHRGFSTEPYYFSTEKLARDFIKKAVEKLRALKNGYDIYVNDESENQIIVRVESSTVKGTPYKYAFAWNKIPLDLNPHVDDLFHLQVTRKV